MADTFELPGRVGLGTAPLGSGDGWELDWGSTPESDGQAVVGAAVQAGAGWIDTAPFYGWGRAERIVGAALRDLEQRPVILTKCGTFRRAGGTREDHSAEALRADVAASLNRLGCAQVDVLQLHDADPATPVQHAWHAIADLVDAGQARAGGLSNHPVALMDRAAAVAPVAVVQHQYSLLHRAPETDGVLDWCRAHNAAFLAWSPLASGFLADGFDRALLGPGDFRHRLPWADPAVLNLERLRRDLGAIAGGAGLSMSGLAVGWVLARGVRAIVGARTPAEAAAIAGYRPLPAALCAAAEDAVAQARHGH
jgi:aryl-alcohol dehydrogenase-like predicted oxidoreductase